MFSRISVFLVLFSTLLLTACATQRNPLDEAWYQVESDHFVIVTNGRPEDVRALTSDLERFRSVALELLQARDTADKLTIYATADRQTYAGLAGEELAELTNGLFDTNIHGSYALVNLEGYRGEERSLGREVLFHEYVHFLSYNGNTIQYPYWYSEGIAELLSTMEFSEDGSGYQIGAVPQERADTLLYSPPVPLERLLRAAVHDSEPEDMPRIYASAWMLTHWLVMHSGKKDEFRDFVRAYNRGEDPVVALEKTLGMSLSELERQYQDYFDSGVFKFASGRIPAGFQEPRPRVRRLPQSQALAEIGSYLVLSGYSLHKLEPLMQYARAKGLESPELIAVQADAEVRMGDFDRAQQFLARVPAGERNKPWYQKVQAWLWLSRELGKPMDRRDRQALTNAHGSFKRLANREEGAAIHWYGLALTMEALEYPREQYTEMLEQAYRRAPRDRQVAQWLARELYAQRNAEYFEQVARPLMLELDGTETYHEMKGMLAEMQSVQGEPGPRASSRGEAQRESL